MCSVAEMALSVLLGQKSSVALALLCGGGRCSDGFNPGPHVTVKPAFPTDTIQP